jgi:hypothetical protein
MTEQEQDALEQAAKPQRWGSKERVALVAEVLRWKRIARHLSELIVALTDGEYGENPDYWLREAEKAVADEISPKG